MTELPVAHDRHLVVLSPHFDDAALSLGGLLAAHHGQSTIVTAYGGRPAPGLPVSDWDADCGFVSPEETYTVRLGEDRRACALLGADQVLLDNADGPYAEGRTLKGIEDFLTGLPADAVVFVPLGLIQPDHRAVRELALPILLRGTWETWIYADLPYTVADSSWPQVELDGSTTPESPISLAEEGKSGAAVRRELVLDDSTWSRKRDAVLCYASQLSLVATMEETQGTGALLGRRGPLSTEVVWSAGADRGGQPPLRGRTDRRGRPGGTPAQPGDCNDRCRAHAR